MTALPQVATIHPATVTAHSEGARPLLPVPGHPAHRHPTHKPTSRVTTLTVHPAIWAQALTAAHGDATLIEVHDALHVTVHNSPHWRQ